MPPDEVIVPQSSVVQQSTPVETKSENLQMLLAGLADTDSHPKLTTDQVTQLIEQRSKIHEYIRDDKKDAFELQKIERKNHLHVLYVGAIGVVILSVFVLIFKPEYFAQLLQALVTTLGGYGIGKYQAKKESQEKE